MTLPEPDIALALPLEELAGFVIVHHQTSQQKFNFQNMMLGVDAKFKEIFESSPNNSGQDFNKKAQY